MKKFKVVGSLSLIQKIILIILPILVVILSMGIGRMLISPVEVLKSTFEKFGYDYVVNSQTEIVLWTIRFPRILLALLVGAGLSVAGCAFQSLFSNPLATPDTLGVASGASFGAALGILLGFKLIGIQFCALCFGIIAVLLTYISGTGKSNNMNTIVLAGIMIGSLFSALVSFVKFVADTETQLPAITYWLMGSLGSASYKTLLLGAPFILVGIFVLYLLRWRLNILMLSDDEAKSSGTNINLLRGITIIAATMVTGSCVSMCGQVGWVGLIIPHICRMKFGNNHLALVPASISIGAIFMVVVDTIARSLVATEIPISILTAIIGAPFFITLMRRSGGWQL
ncbi:MAG: iron ABC transporter permease [Intestinibacter sp.]|uniref:FecCD family ABC transporter permease n=1 Tax=Intestinibacter sp. TaxID=1965304 RepID=UPI0025C6F52A|nr:iron ABC transporter permease [Intestinibacter sp.]MCI6736788.1 iron ABC transporter permease [Intestinibacter sp.]